MSPSIILDGNDKYSSFQVDKEEEMSNKTRS